MGVLIVSDGSEAQPGEKGSRKKKKKGNLEKRRELPLQFDSRFRREGLKKKEEG